MLQFRNPGSTLIISGPDDNNLCHSISRTKNPPKMFASHFGPGSGPSSSTTPFKLSSPFYQAQQEQQFLSPPTSDEFVSPLPEDHLRFHALSQLNSNYIPPLTVSPRESMLKSSDEYRYERMSSIYGPKVGGFDEYFSGVYINPNERPTIQGGVSDAMDLLDTPEAMDEDDDDEEEDDDEENMFYVDDEDVEFGLYTDANDYYYGDNSSSSSSSMQFNNVDPQDVLIDESMPMFFSPENEVPLTINPADLTKPPTTDSIVFEAEPLMIDDKPSYSNNNIDSYDEFLGASSTSPSLASNGSSFSSSDEDYESIYQPRRLDHIIPQIITPPTPPQDDEHKHNEQDTTKQENQIVSLIPESGPTIAETKYTSPQSSHYITKTRKHSKATNLPHPPFKCDAIVHETGKECGKVFSRSYDLVRHRDTIHASVRKTFRCEHCGDASKTFSRMDALTRHMRVKHS